MSDASYCPLINGECKKHECKFYYMVQGSDPQSGQPISKWDCAVSLMPLLLIENSQQQRQTGAAVESFRNEMIESSNNTLKVLAAAANLRITRQGG